MLHKLNFSDKFRTVKIFVTGLALGAVVTALSLDNRAMAMIKAFQNPIAINGMTVSMEIVKK